MFAKKSSKLGQQVKLGNDDQMTKQYWLMNYLYTKFPEKNDAGSTKKRFLKAEKNLK